MCAALARAAGTSMPAGWRPTAARRGRRGSEAAGPPYVEDLLAALSVDLTGIRVLLDCAHGATYRMAPLAFRAAGATVEAVAVDPDGVNINAGCGSTHLGSSARTSSRATSTSALPSTATATECSRSTGGQTGGRRPDPGHPRRVAARAGAAGRDTVVVTSMSNLGLHRALRAQGIQVEVTDVGDRYVLERMLARGRRWGASSRVTSYTSMPGRPETASRPASCWPTSCGRDRWFAEPIAGLMTLSPGPAKRAGPRQDASFGGRDLGGGSGGRGRPGEEGRVVLRLGTESLVRVMVEAPTQERCDVVAGRLAEVVERALS